jgi:hypothetical protein
MAAWVTQLYLGSVRLLIITVGKGLLRKGFAPLLVGDQFKICG